MDPSDLLIAGSTLAASLGGYFLAGLNEARRDHRADQRERATRSMEARLRRAEDRHRHQLEALTALQEDVQVLIRQCGRVLAFDHRRAREGQYNQLPDGWSEEELATRMSLKRNLSRVLDEDVRKVVADLASMTASVGALPTVLMELSGEALEQAAMERMAPLVPLGERVHEVIGTALRRELTWEPDALDA